MLTLLRSSHSWLLENRSTTFEPLDVGILVQRCSTDDSPIWVTGEMRNHKKEHLLQVVRLEGNVDAHQRMCDELVSLGLGQVITGLKHEPRTHWRWTLPDLTEAPPPWTICLALFVAYSVCIAHTNESLA